MTQATMWPRKRRSSPLGLVAGAETGSALWCASWLAQRTLQRRRRRGIKASSRCPAFAAHSESLATWRSRSSRWS